MLIALITISIINNLLSINFTGSIASHHHKHAQKILEVNNIYYSQNIAFSTVNPGMSNAAKTVNATEPETPPTHSTNTTTDGMQFSYNVLLPTDTLDETSPSTHAAHDFCPEQGEGILAGVAPTVTKVPNSTIDLAKSLMDEEDTWEPEAGAADEAKDLLPYTKVPYRKS